MLRNWRSLNVGDRVHYYGKDFDGKWDYICTIIIINQNHAIAEWDGVKLYLDDETADLFRRCNNQNF